MVPLALDDQLDAARARQLGELQLAALGLPAHEIVTAAAAGREAHYVISPLGDGAREAQA